MIAIARYATRGPAFAIVTATGLAVLSWLLPPIVFLSGAVLALVAFSQPASRAIQVVIGGTVLLMVFSQMVLGQFRAGLIWSLIAWWPIFVVASVARQYQSVEQGLRLTGYLALLSAAWLGYSGWAETSWGVIVETLTQGDENWSPSAETIEIWRVLEPYAAGIFVAFNVLYVSAGLVLARYWQLCLADGGFGQEFRQLQLGWVFLVFLGVVLMVAWLLDQRLMSNLWMVVMAVFLVPGFVFVHGLANIFQLQSGWLIFFYVAILINLPVMFLGLSVLGMLDTGFGIRRRLESQA